LRFYTAGVQVPKAVPGAVVAIKTFGDFLGFHTVSSKTIDFFPKPYIFMVKGRNLEYFDL
jgi:hypothetical protein